MENETEVKTTALADIKCPVCGGPVNKWQITGWWLDKAVLLCECWSGSSNKPSMYHLFRVNAPVATLKLPEEEEETK